MPQACARPYGKRMGFVPNALKLYMHRPEIAEMLWKLNSQVMRDPSSTLPQLLKRRLRSCAARSTAAPIARRIAARC